MRSLLLLALLACRSGATTAGRVELTTEDNQLVVRDSQHVLEIPLASTRGLTFAPYDLPAASLPGRVAMVDEADGYVIGVWITRLGDKRPENIQRWFDDKLDSIHIKTTTVSNHGAMLPGDHPARFADFHVKAKDKAGYERMIGVDLPEHDLDLILNAIVVTAEPDAKQLAWLDGIAADVRAMHVASPQHRD